MAKRRRKKPNVSQTVLDQARQTAAEDSATSAAAADSTNAAPAEAESPADNKSTVSRTRRRRRDLQAVQLERRRDEGTLEAEYVADLLANPTKIVSEEDLRADYGFVIKDLRNMGILAAALFVALVIVSVVVL